MNLLRELADNVDEVRHGEVEDAMAPSELHDSIRLQQVIARVQHGCEALLVLVLNEVG